MCYCHQSTVWSLSLSPSVHTYTYTHICIWTNISTETHVYVFNSVLKDSWAGDGGGYAFNAILKDASAGDGEACCDIGSVLKYARAGDGGAYCDSTNGSSLWSVNRLLAFSYKKYYSPNFWLISYLNTTWMSWGAVVGKTTRSKCKKSTWLLFDHATGPSLDKKRNHWMPAQLSF